MLILALDTTTRTGSVALVRGGMVLRQEAGDPGRTHAERLPGDVQRVLDVTGTRIGDVDVFAVAAGPGSFTGLRVGIAAIQGLSFSTGRPVVPVSTLDALAHAGAPDAAPIAVWLDAQRGEVFAALYGPDGHHVLVGPTSATPVRTIERWRGAAALGEALYIGDGAVRHQLVLQGALGAGVRVVAPPLLAAHVGLIAATKPNSAVAPHAIVPIYVRPPDVEIARDRRGSGG